MLNSKSPEGPLENKWNHYKGHVNLVNPANKRNLEIIVVGTGLAGASAAAALGELGYKVKAFSFHDSPRRAHSIAAQGVLMLLRIIRMTVIPFFVYFMIQLKEVITGQEKVMCIV